ncbi:hypothetical protein [Bacillus dakarensis]|uniref:hypothetical protein n=1 Tax=Robertmurraya dakarensis TaxID=1926278 RepID=UPI000981F6ED|nr:hypothetical protein [Bacillus dakarensis]
MNYLVDNTPIYIFGIISFIGGLSLVIALIINWIKDRNKNIKTYIKYARIQVMFTALFCFSGAATTLFNYVTFVNEDFELKFLILSFTISVAGMSIFLMIAKLKEKNQ